MGIPKIISEQYPQALGNTIPELLGLLPASKPDEYFVYSKKKFSMMTPECIAKVQSYARKQVIGLIII